MPQAGADAVIIGPGILQGPVTRSSPAAHLRTAFAATASNPIVLENQELGNPENEWGIDGAGSTNIEGFATEISINRGQRIDFKINTDSTNYRIDIYRLGYYGGMGARKLDTIPHTGLQTQLNPQRDNATGAVDAGNWAVSASWNVPPDATSGIYIAKLVRQDGTAGANHIPFIVRDDSSTSDIIFQTSDTTWHAYNPWGGANFYGGTGPATGSVGSGRAYALSYNRPITTRGGGLLAGPQDYIFGVEYPALLWLEKNGYDVSYMAGVDTDRFGNLLTNHKVFLSVGHDEYWSGQQRANVEAARDAGVHLSFWSGNEVYWRTRWAPSFTAGAQPYRTLICYKETWGNGDIDPSNEWTGTFRDPRFVSPTSQGGGRPENALTGTIFQVDSYRRDSITIGSEYANLRFWRNTSIANLQPGQTATLPQGYLGYEWDESPDNGFRPAGLIMLSSTTVPVTQYLLDYGNTVGNGTATHNLTLYRAPSGALVFGAGTVYWAWGLDDNHDNEATPVDDNVKQAMVNLFADMGVQPGTLEAGLVPATQSTDTIKPVSTITSPSVGSTITVGQTVTITGTASDSGGGVVAAVDVSTDSGATWHRAIGRQNWTYSWIPLTAGSVTIKTRAVDDSLNLEIPAAGRTVTVSGNDLVSLFPLTAMPENPNVADNGAVEVGMKFQPSIAGAIAGIRFYKGVENTGTHTGSLWSSTGTRLATVTFTGETVSGWQTAIFPSPVTVTAGTTYIVSYHANAGHYSSTANYFATAVTNGPLTAPSSAAAGGNGVYAYGSSSSFPTDTYQATNYWVDVLFASSSSTVNQPPTANTDTGFIVNQDTPLTIAAASLLANDTDPDGDPLNITSVSGATHGAAAFNAAANTVTFTPTAGYTGQAGFSYSISDGRGGTSSANVSLTVIPASVSLFSSSATPATPSVSDAAPVELGMKFQASVAGTVTGVKFYKSAQNTGTHTGSLWSSTGTRLATVTFAGETASGWQTAIFSSPVTITAGTTYVVSYHTNTGFYSANSNYFSTATANGPLTAPSSASAGGNGVYAYGSSSSFPTDTYQATNYWVDVLFASSSSVANQPPTANNDTGFSTNQDIPLTITAAALLANDTDPNSDPLSITGVSAATHGSVAFNASTNIITFTPTAGYTGAAGFTYSISDGRGGTSSANVSITVTPASVSLFSPSAIPAILSDPETNSVELGMKFQSSVAGTVNGIKFYKGTGDTGTHHGNLWTATGTLLGTVTFTNETASGWQTAAFPSPIPLAAGTTYVVSYHSNGHYAATSNYFSAAATNGPLTAPSSASAGGNGVYTYGSSSLFPTSSYDAANYWVDVLFSSSGGAFNQLQTADSTTGEDEPLAAPAELALNEGSEP
ncbi:DUF4082 domain-containing protein [Microvirga sp. 2MCAF38]|uniref:DUF4082 domain-containing protein n=1 Tax=Microvirga sp. 2MCAF38 TaxID=3232989 RepID=UPI003F9C8A25